ncbi:MAG: hypothetical protein ACU0BB_04525 [Paracoccaceae bacterium]
MDFNVHGFLRSGWRDGDFVDQRTDLAHHFVFFSVAIHVRQVRLQVCDDLAILIGSIWVQINRVVIVLRFLQPFGNYFPFGFHVLHFGNHCFGRGAVDHHSHNAFDSLVQLVQPILIICMRRAFQVFQPSAFFVVCLGVTSIRQCSKKYGSTLLLRSKTPQNARCKES